MARVEDAVRLLDAGDYAGLGETFVASHVSMRDDFEISCPELDAVVDTALAHGALGARMTGGGFGGSAIALVPDSRVDEVEQAVAGAFSGHDWPSPGFLDGTPSERAHRVL
jgi:galactokinase